MRALADPGRLPPHPEGRPAATVSDRTAGASGGKAPARSGVVTGQFPTGSGSGGLPMGQPAGKCGPG